MTIVIGFRCVDGIVICADRQITAPGAFKYHEPKISTEDFETFTAIFAYAGFPELAHEVHDKICAELHSIEPQDHIIETVRDVTAQILTSSLDRLFNSLDLQMLVGVNSCSEGTDLMKFGGKGVYVARDFEYLAYGDSSLVRFLGDKLYTKTFTVKQGMDMAIYLVKKAEDYIDGCGGPIDVYGLEPVDRSVKRFSQKYIQERLSKMEGQEKLLRSLLIEQPFSST